MFFFLFSEESEEKRDRKRKVILQIHKKNKHRNKTYIKEARSKD